MLWPTNLIAGETGGMNFKDLGLGSLTAVAITKAGTAAGSAALSLVSTAVLSAEKEANESCTRLTWKTSN
jgi:hypothetical protein